MVGTLLGLCDSSSEYDIKSSDYTINRLGGRPDWLINTSDISIKCDFCQGEMLFICQMYCPMEGSVNDRVLYFYVCPQKMCNKSFKSWVVLRCQTNNKEIKQKMTIDPVVKIQSAFDAFSFDSLTWDAPGDDNSTLSQTVASGTKAENNPTTVMDYDGNNINNDAKPQTNDDEELIDTDPETKLRSHREFLEPCEDHISDLSLNDTPNDTDTEPFIDPATEEIIKSSVLKEYLMDEDEHVDKHTKNELSKLRYDSLTFLPYYIDVIDEVEDAEDQLSKHERELLKNYLQQENMSLEDLDSMKSSKCKTNNCTDRSDDFELSGISEIQHEFFQTIRKCPQQIIRYSYGGVPLEYNQTIRSTSIPKCLCGAARVFEVQLLPTIINYLIADGHYAQILEAVDFGSVYIYTCSKNCWEDGSLYKQEYICIQADDNLAKSGHHSRKGRYKF